MTAKLILMWFRRDLRLDDNAAFFDALRRAGEIKGKCVAAFCFDTEILSKLENKADRRVAFIHASLLELEAELAKRNSGLIVRIGPASEELPKLIDELIPLGLDSVYANHDFEPRRMKRDKEVGDYCAQRKVRFQTFKDHVVFEKSEILTSQGKPHRVFTAYNKVWHKELLDNESFHLHEYPGPEQYPFLLSKDQVPVSAPWKELKDIGFLESEHPIAPGRKAGLERLKSFEPSFKEYSHKRNLPGIEGTSRLSVHLRFGTVSVREVIVAARKNGTPGAAKWVDELVWRDFFNMILYWFPHTQLEPFQEKFNKMKWDNPRTDEHTAALFEAWAQGQTGFPIVDAGMRELNSTGFMHNRVRMITASFLTKHLHIHWKAGERYFAKHLLDYDLSQNIGGWQWAAGIGADAQPFFRIFNPVTQSETFDPAGDYIRRFCPELKKFREKDIHSPWMSSLVAQETAQCKIGKNYPVPIVDLKIERNNALERFHRALHR
ncbi:MAG: deoxyribodipyrimidine photo-lyase [Verrucomicrobiota bacterium]|nr:deoxyribodipyrimidine photo-lyase [Verrucomicrobiota bacterium]